MYLVTEDSRNLLWTVSGQNKDLWINGLAPFQSNKTHYIVFEGVRGNDFNGDIALDDLLISRSVPCQIQPVNAQPQDISPQLIDCTFEAGKTRLCFQGVAFKKISYVAILHKNHYRID